jgi:predicted nucleic acid-binding protein
MSDQITYMLDTNVFNHILDKKVDLALLKGKRLVATHIQRDELIKTSNDVRRKELLSIFMEYILATNSATNASAADTARADSGSLVPTESAVWDISHWGKAKWGAADNFNKMRQDLDKLNKNKKNNTQDILIAETCLKNGWVLITSDTDLLGVVTKHGGACTNLSALGMRSDC